MPKKVSRSGLRGCPCKEAATGEHTHSLAGRRAQQNTDRYRTSSTEMALHYMAPILILAAALVALPTALAKCECLRFYGFTLRVQGINQELHRHTLLYSFFIEAVIGVFFLYFLSFLP